MLDLNPYWVIFKITHVSTVVVGSRFIGSGSFLERVLGTVLWDDKSTPPHQLVSRVVLVSTPRVSGFDYFFGVLFERSAAHSDGASPCRCRRWIYLIFWTVLSCIYIYYCFVYSVWFIYLVLIVFCTHVSSCVRGGVVTPNPIYLFWDVIIISYWQVIIQFSIIFMQGWCILWFVSNGWWSDASYS
jgi:hypothetical protein